MVLGFLMHKTATRLLWLGYVREALDGRVARSLHVILTSGLQEPFPPRLSLSSGKMSQQYLCCSKSQHITHSRSKQLSIQTIMSVEEFLYPRNFFLLLYSIYIMVDIMFHIQEDYTGNAAIS